MTIVKPNWFDPLFILRPTLFFPSWTFFLAGFHRGQGSHVTLYLIWLGAALGASFLLNQITDRQEDKLNRKLLPLWGDKITLRLVRIEFIVLVVVVVAGCVWVGAEITALLALFFLNAGILYNFPPFRLKNRPILGVVSCGIGIWNGYLIGARCAEVAWTSALLYGLPYALAGAAVSLLTSVPDLGGDLKAGVRTFTAVYGARKTSVAALGLVISSALLSAFLFDFYLLSAAIVALPFFIHFYAIRNRATAEFCVKIAIFSLAVAVGLTWLPFLMIIAGYYPLARWYHQARLGIDYPSFRSKDLERTEKNPLHPEFERVGAI